MRRLALAMCAGALGFSLVACGGGAPATSEPAATQEAGTDATEKADETVADETEATAEEDESTLPEIKQSMLKPFVESFNPKDGMHITYTVSTTFLKEDGSEDYVENFSYDTHIKGNTMFQQKTSLDNPNSVLNSTTAIWNGDLVSLDEQTHTGKILMHDTLASYADDENGILMQAAPYDLIDTRSYDYDFTVEDREVDGTTYTVEVHPQREDYIPQADFYFDQDGNVVSIHMHAIGTDNFHPEQLFTIEAWDKNVDESLLDLSGYEFTELL